MPNIVTCLRVTAQQWLPLQLTNGTGLDAWAVQWFPFGHDRGSRQGLTEAAVLKSKKRFDPSKKHLVVVHPISREGDPFKLLGCMDDKTTATTLNEMCF